MSPEIPSSLVEAAARALHAADCEGILAGADGTAGPDYDAMARVALAAALAECGLGEEFSCSAAGHPTWHRHQCPDTVQRRLVITTPPVDTPREDPRS